MDGKLEISLDKLPVKRLDHIEENGLERYPPDIGYEEKRLSLIRRIDFAWAVEKDEKKKQKKTKESSTPWQWQGMVENLQLAHQELSVIIDLINTVEANDAVAVASSVRPKPLPSEHLSELAISAATKLQCYRNLGKYFKQSAKALEQQIAKEARFYGALIRLQQNWKVKRQRLASFTPGNERFTIDLFDKSTNDSGAIIRPSTISTVPVEHDSAGSLAVLVPPKSCRTLHFGFLGAQSSISLKGTSKVKIEPENGSGSESGSGSGSESESESEGEAVGDDVSVKKTHNLLREVHQAIFCEQVFDLVNREAFSPSLGVNVTGIQEDNLQLSVGQGTSVLISLIPSTQGDQTTESAVGTENNLETAPMDFDSFDGAGEKHDAVEKKIPSRTSYEIYLQQLFHGHVFVRSKDSRRGPNTSRGAGQSAKDSPTLLSHFCLSLAHRMFSNKVLVELENVVSRVPYLHLISHPAWHSRKSSWSLFMKVPQSVFHGSSRQQTTEKDNISVFRTKVVVTDDCISVEGEAAPNVIGLFKGSSGNVSSTNRCSCDLVDLPVIMLQQVASQLIRWLHEDALMMGMKATRDFLCLSFELEQGEALSLVAHVDPEDPQGCISWWMVVDDGVSEEQKLQPDYYDGVSEYRKFLGHLSLEVLYSTLMDLVSLSNGSTTH